MRRTPHAFSATIPAPTGNLRLWLRVLSAAALALCLGAATWGCEEFTTEGDVSDDTINGRNAVQADEPAANAESGSNTSNASDSKSDTRTADTGGNGGSSGSGSATDTSSGTSGGGYNTSGAIGAISWKGKNISSWPITTTLRASVSGGNVTLSYDKKNSWPVVDGVCGNCWAIVNINGKWYAGTFEYLRPGQTSKPSYTLDGSNGDHFKVSPLSSWRPQHGEVFGLMVSGLCRGGLSNVQERSNICVVRWP